MKLKKLSGKLPSSLVVVVVLLVIGDMHLQTPGTLQFRDLAILFFLSAVLIPFGVNGLFYALLIISYLFLFQYRLQFHSSGYLPFQEEQIQTLQGELTDDPAWMGPQILRLKIVCDYVESSEGAGGSADCPFTVYINKKSFSVENRAIGRGTVLRISGSYSDSSSEKGERIFNGRSLSFEGNPPLGQGRLNFLQRIREKSSLISPETEILLPALVLGMDHPSKRQFAELFRRSGSAHIMALSGFHAGLVGLLLFMAGRFFFGSRGGYVLSMAGLVVFLWLVGFRPSLVRAVGMYLLFAAGKLTNRNFNGLCVLLFSYFVYGIVDPSSMDSLSSKLSYLALAGIMTSGNRINTLMEGAVPLWLRLPLCTSLGAQLWTSALVLTVFGQAYPIGLLASLVLTPLVTVYLYVGIFWLLFPDFSLVRALFGWVLITLERILQFCGGFFGHFQPFEAHITGPGPFLLFLIPVLLLEFYRPGSIHGKRKAGFEL